jgi:ABC-2 type transport system permease protein
MRSFYAIYRKEMGHYFVSPIAYVVIAAFVLITAILFSVDLNYEILQAQRQQMQGMQYGMPANFDIPSAVIRGFFGLFSTLVLFLTPMMTMGVYADERKRGTMELLMTSPITEMQIVLGKFAASLTLFAIMLAPTLVYVTFLFMHSDPAPPWRMLAGGYAGILLLGGSVLALGSFISSLTENLIIAAVLTFLATLLIWLLNIGQNLGGALGSTLAYLSLVSHYEDFTRGIVDTSSLIYYFSFMALFIFLTVRSVDSMRWRRA